ncbi:MAG: hypothetical protein A2Z91_03825 [Deltaproteobacteria bacterium GWA2_38_16]|nr:MAG: hypothetical protein A2Z91_03825 [Deltaproteobacteria bacterium GWA2_38_16]OGQ01836.1 MAG: hypothetical protein A3D19_02945 [Deltaproteobacteria bacterium RIFCSPHIGHO2_02_FULL_38_15]OGQ60760.1 MAG: hypothetical protein A3G92_04915 [Deltaproteobacteria bacterium RIFCSPLOWO2_12_FULL_38_8]HBQ20809.1 hypothetical protein [Deltaproteobacteria bacterium]
MKILQLTSHLNVGGITSYLYHLSQGLKKLNIDSSLASSGGEQERDFEHHQITTHSIPLDTKHELSIKLAWSFFKLKKLYKQEKWDLLHAHTRVSQYLAYFLSQNLHIPYVTTFHGFYHHHLGRKLFPCLGHRTIANSFPVEEDLKAHYPTHTPHISTILHGIDTEYFNTKNISDEKKQNFRQEFKIPLLPTLGIVGRLSEEKGHLKLLEILKILIEKHRQKVQLLMIGDGKMKSSILKKIEELKLSDSVFLLPTQKDPRTALSLIDVYVTFQAGPEGFGLSFLEAMSLGKPLVISYSKGGMADFLENEKEGFLLHNSTLETMAEKINTLLNFPELQKEMGQKGAQKIKEYFSYERMAEQTRSIYEQVL